MRVLKIGGSVLTDKGGVEEPKEDEIRRVAAEVAESPRDLVLVHGAGSYGHPHVEKHLDGDAEHRLRGASRTHTAVTRLSERLIRALRDEGVTALPVRPLSCGTARDGELEELYLGAVRRMLAADVLPVLHGDVVMARGDVTVVSGDEVVVTVAEELGADRVGYGTDVPGVLDAEGEPVDSLNRDGLDEIDFYAGTGTDLTGGMRNKVLSLIDSGTTGAIFDATTPGNVSGFLAGKRLGTEVSP